jgi:hypothetical protein
LTFLVDALHYLAEIDTFFSDLDLVFACLAHCFSPFGFLGILGMGHQLMSLGRWHTPL